MLEFEKKIMLTEAEYVFLENSVFANTQTINQTNYYYDNELYEMNKRGITFRIREIDGVYITIMKDHSKKDTDCSVERQFNLDSVYNDSFLKKMGLSCHGNLHTERNTLVLNDVQVMLDKNEYLDTVDYELEIEYPMELEDNALNSINTIAEILFRNGILNTASELINRIGVGKNKSERFFERKIAYASEV